MPYKPGDRRIRAYTPNSHGFTEAGRIFNFFIWLPKLVKIGIDPICPWMMTHPSEAAAIFGTDSIHERLSLYMEFSRRVVIQRNLPAAATYTEIAVYNADGTDLDGGAGLELGVVYHAGHRLYGHRSDWRNSGELMGGVTVMLEQMAAESGGFHFAGDHKDFLQKLDLALDPVREQPAPFLPPIPWLEAMLACIPKEPLVYPALPIDRPFALLA